MYIQLMAISQNHEGKWYIKKETALCCWTAVAPPYTLAETSSALCTTNGGFTTIYIGTPVLTTTHNYRNNKTN